jgi:predicted transcriptional regulator
MTTESQASSKQDLLSSLTEIVSSYLRQNTLPLEKVPGFIGAVHEALLRTQGATSESGPKPQPALPVEQSVMPEYITCLEDGVRVSMLRRHLTTRHGLTPAEYRAKWGLRPDYPMVAPDYAARRRAIAKAIGLGRRVSRTRASAGAEEHAEREPAPPPARRGRARRKGGTSDGERASPPEPAASTRGRRKRRLEGAQE